MFARYLGRLATGAVVGGGASTVIQPNESNNAIDRTSQQSSTAFEPYHYDDFQAPGIENSTAILTNEQTMLTFGVTGSEFDCAIASIQEHPDILFDILPSMNLKRRNQLSNVLDNILNNPQIISTVKSKINGNHTNENLLDTSNDKIESFTNDDDAEMTNNSKQWELLKNEHPCVICQDLLAKPTILQCSHSFCGSCLDELFTTSYTISPSSTSFIESSQQDGGIDVFENHNHIIYQCPTCKQDILQQGIYERTLDDVIYTKAQLIKNCPEKTYWIERRNAHAISKQNNMHRKSNDNNQNTNEDGDDDSWESIQNWAIPAIAFVIITLIAICRYK